MKSLIYNSIVLPGIKPFHKVVIYWAIIWFCLLTTTAETGVLWCFICLVNFAVAFFYIKNNVKEPQWLKDLEDD